MKHRASTEKQVTDRETAAILDLLQKTLAKNIPGDVVEFGCYRGDTSVELQRNSDRKLWLYDSFAGLPEKSPEDSSAAGDQFRQGELLVTKREVIEKFKKCGLKVPKIKKAFFSDLDPVQDLPEKIAFAFLDGDLYQSIRDSFTLVSPRMSPGGVIIVHDYNNPELPGVARAVDEFCQKNHHQPLVRNTLAILEV
ncbi:class I SAM-dependent methyltransferase [Candidatus Saccharibacteria bacterium]|nr:class I SAM-dependent methyltransferase [Candidatus Saccharibacteria bacterium]